MPVMVMHTASANAFGYAPQPGFGHRSSFAFEGRTAGSPDTDVAARASRLRLTIGLSALGLSASAIIPLAGIHGGQMLGAALGLAALVVLSQAFDALHRLKMQAAVDEDDRQTTHAFDRRPLTSFRHGAR